MERGQGGHVETEEQAEKEAEQSAERSLKLIARFTQEASKLE